MTTFFLKVLASDKVFFEGHVESVTIPATDGEICFMAHHEEMVVAVQPGVLTFRTQDGEVKTAVVGTGFAQTANNRTTILVETAERPEDIDEVRAREDIERAKEELRQKQSIQEYRISQAALLRAMARLKGKRERGIES